MTVILVYVITCWSLMITCIVFTHTHTQLYYGYICDLPIGLSQVTEDGALCLTECILTKSTRQNHPASTPWGLTGHCRVSPAAVIWDSSPQGLETHARWRAARQEGQD